MRRDPEFGNIVPGVFSPLIAIEPLVWGTHKKMTENGEQELREFMRLKHHSHGLKNQHLG
jgi:hypothetical protein